MTDRSGEFPTSIDAAVRLLQGLVPEDEQAKIAALTQDELMALHFGLGQWVRNNLGLWGTNSALLAATDKENADDASAVIMNFWFLGRVFDRVRS